MGGRVIVMDGRGLVRSIKVFGSAQGWRTVRAAWRRHRADACGLPARGAERARVPGLAVEAEPGPGGGTVRFARSSLRICVSAGGTVFWGWDGAGPLPSYAVAAEAPEPDPRASLEPDTGGGWRIVSERVTVAVSRHGAVEIRTPGGVMLRRDLPPRWWEPVAGGEDGGSASGGAVPGGPGSAGAGRPGADSDGAASGGAASGGAASGGAASRRGCSGGGGFRGGPGGGGRRGARGGPDHHPAAQRPAGHAHLDAARPVMARARAL
ncbi:hypothetical protein ADK34_11555, partial [Streptomyces viridochromogenes]